MMNKAMALAVLAAGIVSAPLAHADGTQASAEQAVRNVYNKVQARCTPSMAPSFQRIAWNSVTGQGGTGRIIDANPRLGGPFHVWWDNTGGSPPAGTFKEPAQPEGYWDVTLEFC
jgi:hypothetical protein